MPSGRLDSWLLFKLLLRGCVSLAIARKRQVRREGGPGSTHSFDNNVSESKMPAGIVASWLSIKVLSFLHCNLQC